MRWLIRDSFIQREVAFMHYAKLINFHTEITFHVNSKWMLSQCDITSQRQVMRLRWRHTVPKLMPNGHMKMKHGMVFRIFFGSQRFCEDSRSLCSCSRNTTGFQTMAYDALMNGLIFLQCFLQSLPNFGTV